jgi:hypothetical protein
VVSIRADADVVATMRVDGHERTVTNSPDVHHDFDNWQVVGTTPLEDFELLLSGSMRKVRPGCSGEISVEVTNVHVRIDKPGYQRIALDRVSVRPDGTKLELSLQPINDAHAANVGTR